MLPYEGQINEDAAAVAFIVCVNNEAYFEECQYYINRLSVPEGYKTEILSIREADSMCAAYNLAMRSTAAKYKVYLHQDVFIRQENFLDEILRRFRENPEVGMIGMVGGNDMPKSGVVFDKWNEGKIDVREPDMAYQLLFNPEAKGDAIVEAIDGCMIITQYDLPWREDLFTHFDFYDVSQAFEFRKRGYQILVPYQEQPWIIHDCGFCKLGKYDEDRRLLVSEYARFLLSDRETEFVYDREWDELSRQLAACIQKMLEAGNWDEAKEAIQVYHQRNFKSTELEILSVMLEIRQAEGDRKPGFFDGLVSYADMYEKYLRVRFLLRRIELEIQDTESRRLLDEIRRGELSCEAVLIFLVHSIVNKHRLLAILEEIYKTSGQTTAYRKVHALAGIWKEKGIPIVFGSDRMHMRDRGSKE